MREWSKAALKKIEAGDVEPVSYDEANAALSKSANIATRYTVKPRNEENFKANTEQLKAGKGIAEYADMYYGRPGFIVGAGPSLDINAEQLKRVEGKHPILAVDAALPCLKAKGIEPDFTMIVDTKAWQKQFFEDYDPGKTILLAISCVHPEVLKVWRGEVRFFNTWADPDDTEAQLKYGQNFGSVDVGGNVSTTLLAFAKGFLSCNPVVFVGHDFSNPFGRFAQRYYAEGGIHTLRPVTKRRFRMHDIRGGWVETDLSLWQYKVWTENWIRGIKEHLVKIAEETDEEVKAHTFINATEGGILGTHEKILENQDDILEFRTLEKTINEIEEGE